jgi:DNA-binding SARP family transcriptional activator
VQGILEDYLGEALDALSPDLRAVRDVTQPARRAVVRCARAAGLAGSRATGAVRGRLAAARARPRCHARRRSVTESMRIRLLGGFGLVCDGEEIELPLSAQRLLAFLAIQDVPLLRVYVAGVLWPGTSEKRSYANLRSALCRVRRPGHAIVDANGATVRLAPRVSVDFREATKLSRDLLQGSHAEPPACGMQSLCWDLLPDWYDEWLESERERLRQLRLHALETLVELHLASGDYGLATEAGLAALREDRLRETANHALIRTYLAEGNATEAIRHYRSYERLLLRELGMAPSQRMQELLDSMPELSRAVALRVTAGRRSTVSPAHRWRR